MRWERDRYAVEMTNEPTYSFGSMDNPHSYLRELLLESEYAPSSKHGLVCWEGGDRRGSVVVGASGGSIAVHEHSCVLLADRCFVAVGDRALSFVLPDLSLLWESQVDDATCFGLHLTPDEQCLVVHGELEISKLALDGRRLWRFGGQDIFTGDCVLSESLVVVTDFNDRRYRIDLANGAEK